MPSGPAAFDKPRAANKAVTSKGSLAVAPPAGPRTQVLARRGPDRPGGTDRGHMDRLSRHRLDPIQGRDCRVLLEVRRSDETRRPFEVDQPKSGRQRTHGVQDFLAPNGPGALEPERDVPVPRPMGAHTYGDGEETEKGSEKEEEVSVLRPLRPRSSPDRCTPLCRGGTSTSRR